MKAHCFAYENATIKLREGCQISARGALTVGRIVPTQDRDTALHVMLRISRQKSISVNNDHPEH
ncbi:hypothetical protein EI77_03814 [Prosthecobacter fusiformis]|uniref:Uncharacterized protein n=1 Tax=Prosthecobacter fusiformis TaxID=48464 RepID=A0A4R7RPB1_9BACT|nr:hypothetical protein EI77_03814 [Prosthecobacter fusiformis]